MYNFHSHNYFCDGSDKPEAYIEEALRQGFLGYGFSSHAPIPIPNDFALTEETFPEYRDEIERLKAKYQGKIKIFLGAETDYIPGLTVSFDDFRSRFRLDYLIGSIHIVKNAAGDTWFIDGPLRESYDDGLRDFFQNNIRLAVTSFYHQTNEMLEKESFEIIGHFDKITMHNQNRYFTTDETWYRKLVWETIDLIKEKNVVAEVNTRGLYKKRSHDFFPETFILQQLYKENIPIMINADAHVPREIGMLRNEAVLAMRNIGFKEQAIVDDNGLKMIAL